MKRPEQRTIRIDFEAYERLKSMRKPGESFSQVIKRVIKAPFDVGAWLDHLRRHPISKAVGDAIEGSRRRSTTRPWHRCWQQESAG